MPHQPAEERCHNFEEVALGARSRRRAARSRPLPALQEAALRAGLPGGDRYPRLHLGAAASRRQAVVPDSETSNALPAVCGRVCPQESQCEATCVVGAKYQAGGDRPAGALRRRCRHGPRLGRSPAVHAAVPKRAAIIGSGPAGLACAGDLARNGVKVTIFEALHVAGGVLKYGIPEFRLPDMIIDAEIENMKKLGVEIRLDTIIGKLFTIPQLLDDMGYDAVFVGTGAGSPKFAGHPGRGVQRRLLGQRVSHARQPDARPPAADLRHAGRDGQAGGGGRGGQHGDGFLPRAPSAWARRR